MTVCCWICCDNLEELLVVQMFVKEDNSAGPYKEDDSSAGPYRSSWRIILTDSIRMILLSECLERFSLKGSRYLSCAPAAQTKQRTNGVWKVGLHCVFNVIFWFLIYKMNFYLYSSTGWHSNRFLQTCQYPYFYCTFHFLFHFLPPL